VTFARIAELLAEKYQLSIQRAAVFKFLKVRARWRRKEASEKRASSRTWNTRLVGGPHSHIISTPAGPRTDAVPPSAAGTENRRPWPSWHKEKPVSPGKSLTTFTPSNEYNLTRLTPEEAAAYVEQLKSEREKNGG
jgi:hypothetical protein